jgi:hypothetical protein
MEHQAEPDLFENAIEYLRRIERTPLGSLSDTHTELKNDPLTYYLLPQKVPITEANIIRTAATMIDRRAKTYMRGDNTLLIGFNPMMEKLPLRLLRANVEHIKNRIGCALEHMPDGNYVMRPVTDIDNFNTGSFLKAWVGDAKGIAYYYEIPAGVTAMDMDGKRYSGVVPEREYANIISGCYADGKPYEFAHDNFHHAEISSALMRRLVAPLGLTDTAFAGTSHRTLSPHRLARIDPKPVSLRQRIKAMPRVTGNLFQQTVDALDGFEDEATFRSYSPRTGKLAYVYRFRLPDDWNEAMGQILSGALQRIDPHNHVTPLENEKSRYALVRIASDTLPRSRLQIEIGKIQEALKSAMQVDEGWVSFSPTRVLHDYRFHLGSFFSALLDPHKDVECFLRIPSGMVVTDAAGVAHKHYIEQRALEGAKTNMGGTPNPRDFTFGYISMPHEVWRQVDYKLGMHEEPQRGLAH